MFVVIFHVVVVLIVTTQYLIFLYDILQGYQIAATRNGNDCLCGNTIRNGHEELQTNACKTPCAGGKDAICGGPHAASVYMKVE